MAKIISILETFVLKLLKKAANQSALSLNRGLSVNFWLLKNKDHEIFAEEYIVYRVAGFNFKKKKMFTNS